MAGSKSNWVSEFRNALTASADLLDPMSKEDEFNAKPIDYIVRDLGMLDEADFLVACIDFPQYSGVAAEIGIAHAFGIPAVLITKMGRVDMFLASLCRATFTSVEDAAKFVSDRWLLRS